MILNLRHVKRNNRRAARAVPKKILNDRIHFGILTEVLCRRESPFIFKIFQGEIMKNKYFAAVAFSLFTFICSASAQMTTSGNPMVGGAPMYSTKTIVDNAINSKDHTTLVAAVKAAGLVDTLESAGPFTVFAPVNSAFDALPAGTVEMLLKPENKNILTKILTYHVIAGRMDSVDIARAIRKGRGTAMFKTVSGGTLKARMDGKVLVLVDEKGGTSRVTIADVRQSNGVIHVVDTVLLPN
jgi:uncharacterized surface protein with fasciclin (FAS1) repeats